MTQGHYYYYLGGKVGLGGMLLLLLLLLRMMRTYPTAANTWGSLGHHDTAMMAPLPGGANPLTSTKARDGGWTSLPPPPPPVVVVVVVVVARNSSTLPSVPPQRKVKGSYSDQRTQVRHVTPGIPPMKEGFIPSYTLVVVVLLLLRPPEGVGRV